VPIALPNLDDVTWKDLTDEARSLIPAWAPDWTNHNPSDPGITLVELFAYTAETLIYRVNRVGDPNIREFLKLVNGPTSKITGNVWDRVRTTVQEISEIHRAVTAPDFENLTFAANKHLRLANDEVVKRVKCLPEHNLEDESLAARSWSAAGHVTVVVLSSLQTQPTPELLRRVRHALEPARLLGTRVHVVGPRYVSLAVRLTLVRKRNTTAETLRMRVVRVLENFFDPLTGGFDNKGWPFGGHVYVSEVYQILNDIPGVDYVKRSRNPEGDEDMPELIISPGQGDRLKWNSLGELDAVLLQPYELIEARINPADITIIPE
jgi:hypothetical protein